jgi:MinD-like ATPase involved in chromosome partitioning or flagellar assembly
MKTIAFYSYKGGTGRSLALANAARYLARLGFRVLAVDFDLEAPGLHYKFSEMDDGSPVSVARGLVDYLDQFMRTGSPPESIQPFLVNLAVPGVEKQLLSLFPAGDAPSKSYWSSLSRINWHDLFYSPTGYGVQLFLEMKARIEDEISPDFLLVDSRTGLTEMGGVATTLLADKTVCVVLPTRENLEGARAVLQSIRRSRRDNEQPELDVMIALSRLSQSDSDKEQNHVSQVRAILSEPALDAEDTLTYRDVFVLHTEPGLEIRDSLRIGSGISPDESVLLRDYLKLFANVVPPQSVEEKIGSLVDTVRKKVWEEPEVAQKELEELAESFGRPEIYRALLHLYGVRNASGPVMLKTAQRLWELTGTSSDPLLWQTLKKEFKASRRQLEGIWTPRRDFMDFVESVWRNAGQKDAEFALKLAEAYAAFEQSPKAAKLLAEVIADSAWTPAVIAMAVRMFDAANRSEDASKLIRDKRDLFESDPYLINAWAEHALRIEDSNALAELTEPPRMVVRQARPTVAARIYFRLNMLGEANVVADQVLAAIGEEPLSEVALNELGQLFSQLRRSEELEERLHNRYPGFFTGQIKHRIRNRKLLP